LLYLSEGKESKVLVPAAAKAHRPVGAPSGALVNRKVFTKLAKGGKAPTIGPITGTNSVYLIVV